MSIVNPPQFIKYPDGRMRVKDPPESILEIFDIIAGSGCLLMSGRFPYMSCRMYKMYEHVDVRDHHTYWLVIDGHRPKEIDVFDWCGFIDDAGADVFFDHSEDVTGRPAPTATASDVRSKALRFLDGLHESDRQRLWLDMLVWGFSISTKDAASMLKDWKLDHVPPGGASHHYPHGHHRSPPDIGRPVP